MTPLDAAYHVVHDHPGGATALAPRMGKSNVTLCQELTATGTAKLGLMDALKITHLTGDYRILYAFAESCGHMAVPLPHVDGLPDPDLMRALADSSRDLADLCREVCDAAADGRISNNELRRVELARASLMAHLARLGETVTAMNLASKPAHAR